MNKRTAFTAAAATTVALLAAGGTQLASAAAPSVCGALSSTIYAAAGTDGSTLLSSSSSEVTKAGAQGYQATGAVFRAATAAGSGLVGVHRMYRTSTKDFLYTSSASEVSSAAKTYGYTDQGVQFYVAAAPASCTTSVPRFVKGSQHRLDVNGSSAAMTAAGWRKEAAVLNVAPLPPTSPPTAPTTPPAPPAPPASSRFSFAVIPDTQLEVLKSNDVRLAARNRWLNSQDVSFVAQTGDLVNWDTDTHDQYQRAKAGMDVLTQAHTPYTVAVGNHDTEATGVGGSARPGKTWELIRDTSTLNHYFTADDFGDVGGAFEPGKIDNVFATYNAGGKKWMVITLEFCARKAVVDWARQVVASHPDYNVIISTHYYLNADASIGTNNQGYGATSPQYVYDNLVSQYPNIKFVFSGHVGYAQKSRVDTGVHGNKIHSFLTTFHEGKTNPVRMITVDTAKDTVSSTIYAPFDGQTWSKYDETISGEHFVG